MRELEPALLRALSQTPPTADAIEIGSRMGGSSLLIMWHLANESKGRQLESVDHSTTLGGISEHAQRLGVNWKHSTREQSEWAKEQGNRRFGYVYHDGDHTQAKVYEDISYIAPQMVTGAILAVDDVHEWGVLPTLKEFGLRPVEIECDRGPVAHNGHVAFWEKS